MDDQRYMQRWRRNPNPETRAAHRKEFRQQVLLPLFLFIFVCGAAVGAAIYFDIGSVDRWSQIAVIFMMLIWMVVGLLALILFVTLIFVISRILALLPQYTRIAQEGIQTIKRQVETGADITVNPVIKIRSFLAVIDALLGRR